MIKMFPELFCSEVATQLWQRLTDLESSLMKEEATAAWAALAALAAVAALAAAAAVSGAHRAGTGRPGVRAVNHEQLAQLRGLAQGPSHPGSWRHGLELAGAQGHGPHCVLPLRGRDRGLRGVDGWPSLRGGHKPKPCPAHWHHCAAAHLHTAALWPGPGAVAEPAMINQVDPSARACYNSHK